MLSEIQIQNIVQQIVLGYQPEKIFLFGSYSNGTANAFSDLDLLIIKSTNENFNSRPKTVRELFIKYPCAMDIFVFTPDEFSKRKKIFGTLAYTVNREGKIIYGN